MSGAISSLILVSCVRVRQCVRAHVHRVWKDCEDFVFDHIHKYWNKFPFFSSRNTEKILTRSRSGPTETSHPCTFNAHICARNMRAHTQGDRLTENTRARTHAHTHTYPATKHSLFTSWKSWKKLIADLKQHRSLLSHTWKPHNAGTWRNPKLSGGPH